MIMLETWQRNAASPERNSDQIRSKHLMDYRLVCLKAPEHIIAESISSHLTLNICVMSTGYPSCSALPDCPAGPDKPSVPGQEEAPGGDGSSVGPERGAGKKVSGLQEGAGWHLASSGGDQVGGEIWVYELVRLTSSVKCYQGCLMVDWAVKHWVWVRAKLLISVKYVCTSTCIKWGRVIIHCKPYTN